MLEQTQSTILFQNPTHPTEKHGNKLLIVHISIPVYIGLSGQLLDFKVFATKYSSHVNFVTNTRYGSFATKYISLDAIGAIVSAKTYPGCQSL